MRRSYEVNMSINGREIKSESITDDVILELVKKLNGGFYVPDARKDNFEYFKTDPVVFKYGFLKTVVCS